MEEVSLYPKSGAARRNKAELLLDNGARNVESVQGKKTQLSSMGSSIFFVVFHTSAIYIFSLMLIIIRNPVPTDDVSSVVDTVRNTYNFGFNSSFKTEEVETQIVSHFHPNFPFYLEMDQINWTKESLLQPFNDHKEKLDQNAILKYSTDLEFLPYYKHKLMVYFNDFWSMLRDYLPINAIIKQLFSTQTVQNKWSAGFINNTFESEAIGDVHDQDSLNETLLGMSPYIFVYTIVVSISHNFYVLLAITSDILFWKERKSLEGLSVFVIFFDVFHAVIALLYVIDKDMNTMMHISCFVSLGIECWKIKKVLDIFLDQPTKYLYSFEENASYEEPSVELYYDDLGFNYLPYVSPPFIYSCAFVSYSLVFNGFDGLYSEWIYFLLTTLPLFGVLAMIPQLFINNKLKSVPLILLHKMFFMFLSGLIVDLLLIRLKMPTTYCLRGFKDNAYAIVFIIFMHQKKEQCLKPT